MGISIDYTIVAQVLSFLVLVWIIAKFAWNPLMKVMEDRRTFIETSLATAEKEKQQAEQIKKEYQEEMRKARQEAQEIIAKATKAGGERAQEVLNQAREEAVKVKSAALVDIQRERDRAVAEVKAQVADLSVTIAEKIIQQKIDLAGQDQLIEQFIQEVGEMQ
ncbi:ATPase, F0 complex, subunit B/B', bacterial/chloroplast [Acididesulfobacillus acetoxydans]|uniref:ATP synthase subunit b n=1 Tax=Acididesulfobacillus acetoxydans TaxID=1561005 RepID=A0A8S0X330_9FIRM|nr:F0F1 ATP synthase subunit B [Acididesulfobacillus acetoxydans]CAA7599730.1 ATPase, F0 complex, subunit B/B', bacterial/chloroplast [Acididesulfobacillus acetoxydans]CEJ06282.1 ATP synthase subunit b [Acididesulfobacillus acetoxydans]